MNEWLDAKINHINSSKLPILAVSTFPGLLATFWQQSGAFSTILATGRKWQMGIFIGAPVGSVVGEHESAHGSR